VFDEVYIFFHFNDSQSNVLITSVKSPRGIKYTSLRPSGKLRKPTKNSHAVAVLNFAVTFCTMATAVWNWRPTRKVWWNHGHSHLFLPKQWWTHINYQLLGTDYYLFI